MQTTFSNGDTTQRAKKRVFPRHYVASFNFYTTTT